MDPHTLVLSNIKYMYIQTELWQNISEPSVK